jgi:hypothetical protein
MSYDFKTFKFGRGNHSTRGQGMCVMEAVAYLAGEDHSDHPECASPMLSRLAIYINDCASGGIRDGLLSDLPWRMIGTKNEEAEAGRRQAVLELVLHEFLPKLMRKTGLNPDIASRLKVGTQEECHKTRDCLSAIDMEWLSEAVWRTMSRAIGGHLTVRNYDAAVEVMQCVGAVMLEVGKQASLPPTMIPDWAALKLHGLLDRLIKEHEPKECCDYLHNKIETLANEVH